MNDLNSMQPPVFHATGSVPVPDPTSLTTAQLFRELEALRVSMESLIDAQHELRIAEISGLKDTLTALVEASDKALALQQATIDRLPGGMDEKIHAAREVIQQTFSTLEQRFLNIQTQFEERDVRVKEAALAATTAVNAALQAAKEAVGEANKSFALSIEKSETSTAKQIEALQQSGEARTRATDVTINDLKERVTRIESTGVGVIQQKSEARAEGGMQWMVIGGVIGVCGFLASIAFGVIAITAS